MSVPHFSLGNLSNSITAPWLSAQHFTSAGRSTWLYTATTGRDYSSPEACSVCELSKCVYNPQANYYKTLKRLINTICSKSLYMERNAETNYKGVMPRFPPHAALYACKGKTSQNNPTATEAQRKLKVTLCMCFHYSDC